MEKPTGTNMLLGIIILLVTFTANFAKEKPKCEFKKEADSIIDIEESKSKNKNATVVAGFNFSTEAQCNSACCQKGECNIYVFYNSTSREGNNCFLIACKPPDSENFCVRKRNFSKSVVGVKLKVVKSAIPTQVTTKPVTTQQNQTSAATSTSPTTNAIKTELSSTVKTKTKATKNVAQESPSNHTNNSSLVIALFFGFLFLFAVIVLVGRPWLNFLQRPRYSKVDYLMNGL